MEAALGAPDAVLSIADGFLSAASYRKYQLFFVYEKKTGILQAIRVENPACHVGDVKVGESWLKAQSALGEPKKFTNSEMVYEGMTILLAEGGIVSAFIVSNLEGSDITEIEALTVKQAQKPARSAKGPVVIVKKELGKRSAAALPGCPSSFLLDLVLENNGNEAVKSARVIVIYMDFFGNTLFREEIDIGSIGAGEHREMSMSLPVKRFSLPGQVYSTCEDSITCAVKRKGHERLETVKLKVLVAY